MSLLLTASHVGTGCCLHYCQADGLHAAHVVNARGGRGEASAGKQILTGYTLKPEELEEVAAPADRTPDSNTTRGIPLPQMSALESFTDY